VFSGESAVETILDELHCTAMPCMPNKAHGEKKVSFEGAAPPFDVCMYEVCCSPTSMLGNVAKEYNIPHVRFHKGEFDILNKSDCAELETQALGVKRPVLVVSLPCTDWTQWQQVNCHQYGESFRKALFRRRVRSKIMLRNALAAGDKVIAHGGGFLFEWPRNASGWKLDILLEFIQKHNLILVDFEGCAVGLTDAEGIPHLKRWKFVTNNIRLENFFKVARRSHDADFKHSPITGSKTEKTGYYPRKMCQMIVNALFPAQTSSFIPAMPCQPVTPQTTHREHIDFSNNMFHDPIISLLMRICENERVPAMATRLLDRKEKCYQIPQP
jgi:hypothetical protein